MRLHSVKFFAVLVLVAFALLTQANIAMAAATAPPLGIAKSFAVLGGVTITNTGATIIHGDLGLYPGTSITGFPPGIVAPAGTIHAADAVARQAHNDATTAYNALGVQTCDFGPVGPTDLAGTTLAPGVHCFSSSVQNSGVVTLNGTASDVWVFKIGSTLTTGSGSSVVFTGGASKCNVFWQVGSSATLGTGSSLQGTIVALTSITIATGATLNGRALARNGAVTLDGNSVDASGCAGVAAPGGVGINKTFTPSNIAPGGISTLSITFANATSALATLTAPFTDNLPAGLVIANPSNLATTCGGVPTAVAGGSSVTLPTGSTIPGGSNAAPGSCTLTVDVTATAQTAACYLNTVPVGALQTSGGNNSAAPAANLCVVTATNVPTLSAYAIIALMLMLLGIGFAATRRRNA